MTSNALPFALPEKITPATLNGHKATAREHGYRLIHACNVVLWRGDEMVCRWLPARRAWMREQVPWYRRLLAFFTGRAS
jgi:hypothetical protein